MATLRKFDPTLTMSLRGFDRRGSTTSMHSTSATGFTISGNYADAADFWVFLAYDADDAFGHLYSSKYLPNFDHEDIVLDFDLAITNGMYVGSTKFQSVPWGAWSWIKEDGTSGTTPFDITSETGGVAATVVFTIGGVAAAFDRIQIIYNSNVVFDYILGGGDSLTSTAAALVGQINGLHTSDPVTYPITATNLGPIITITHDAVNCDGNTVEFYARAKTPGTTTISPSGNVKMTGGIDPTSCHITLDMTAEGLDTVRQLWITGYPRLPIDSGGSDPTLITYVGEEFSYIFINWTVTDPSSKGNLYVPNKEKSVVVGSRDARIKYTGVGWGEESGFFFGGFARSSSISTNTITIRYSCQYVHDLYLGTSLYVDRGIFECILDSVPLSDLDTYANVASNLNTRRLLTTSITAGTHTLVLTVKTNEPVYFDYLHAVIPDDPITPSITYPTVSAACDYDTDQTYKIPPSRLLNVYTQLGFLGDVDFYAGVFFALKRRRRGGFFHSYVAVVAGVLDSGTGFGDGDSFFITIGGTSLGVSVFPADDLDSVVDRFVNGVNNSFVGVRAERTGTGELTVTSISPINGFTTSVSSSTVAATWMATGDLEAGNEGIWEIDDAQPSPLNRAFVDYLTDFTTLFDGAGITFTLAFSEELLAPPDVDTIAGAYIQRYSDGTAVLTATGFGSWGSGYVEAVAGSGTITIQQTGHGYESGYEVSINGGNYTAITYVDADHYSVVGTAAVGNLVISKLKTAHCTMNPSTTTMYLSLVFQQAAILIDGLGVIPWLQFGEFLHWFFDNGTSMAYYDAWLSDYANTALGRPMVLFTNPDDDPSVNAFADADVLQDVLDTHMTTIRADVLAVVPIAKFEFLFPYDVNYKLAYTNGTYPFFLGGQLNRYINLPPGVANPGGSIERLKVEALAWGTSFRVLTNAVESIQFYRTDTTWPLADVIYLLPWQNGGCPYVHEYHASVRENIPTINFWALDHAIIFSWPLPFPEESKFSQVV